MSEAERPLDSELNFRMITWLTVGLLLVVAVAGVLVWMLTNYLRQQSRETDPPPPMLLEARMPHLPPAPRLQTEPFKDLEELRAAEDRELESYGWVDRASGVARLPIERAIELVVEEGLSTWSDAVSPAAAADDAPEER